MGRTTPDANGTDARDGGTRRPDRRRAAASGGGVISWPVVAYVLVLVLACTILVPLTPIWWIVPVLGVAAPIALVALSRLEGRTPGAAVADEPVVPTPGLLADQPGEVEPKPAPKLPPGKGSGAAAARIVPNDDRHPVAPAATGAAAESGPSAPATGNDGAAAAKKAPSAPAIAPPSEPLSERELDVLAALAAGKTTAEAARDLFVAPGTIKSHTGNIYRKLGARNRAEAIARARALGLLP